MRKISLSSTIVTHKSNLENLRQTIDSYLKSISQVQKFYDINFTFFIVDNSLSSLYLQELKNILPSFIKLIVLDKNKGFGHGHNSILPQINSDYHLVLNPDVILQEDALLLSVHYLNKNHHTSLLVPQIFSFEGERQYLCKTNPTLLIMFLRGIAPSFIKKIFSSYLKKHLRLDDNYEEVITHLDYPSGCFMFFRTSFFCKINQFL